MTVSMKRDKSLIPAFLTPKQLAARWGLTTMTLRRWRHAGELRAHRIGRGVRFSLAEVERIEAEGLV